MGRAAAANELRLLGLAQDALRVSLMSNGLVTSLPFRVDAALVRSCVTLLHFMAADHSGLECRGARSIIGSLHIEGTSRVAQSIRHTFGAECRRLSSLHARSSLTVAPVTLLQRRRGRSVCQVQDARHALFDVAAREPTVVALHFVYACNCIVLRPLRNVQRLSAKDFARMDVHDTGIEVLRCDLCFRAGPKPASHLRALGPTAALVQRTRTISPAGQFRVFWQLAGRRERLPIFRDFERTNAFSLSDFLDAAFSRRTAGYGPNSSPQSRLPIVFGRLTFPSHF